MLPAAMVRDAVRPVNGLAAWLGRGLVSVLVAAACAPAAPAVSDASPVAGVASPGGAPTSAASPSGLPAPTGASPTPVESVSPDEARRRYPVDVTSAVLRGAREAPAGFAECAAQSIGAERVAQLRAGTVAPSGQDNDRAAICLARVGAPASAPGAAQDSAARVKLTGSSYPAAPTAARAGFFRTGQPADLMLSGVDFDNAGGPLVFNHPSGIATDGRRLFVADTFNNRVLIWDRLTSRNDAPPDLVLGQPDLSSDRPGSGKHELNWPMSVASDGSRIVVTDTNNDRILVWNAVPTVNGAPADLVIRRPGPTGQRGVLVWPWGVWTDGSRLAVTSTGGGAVLIWTRFPTVADQAPDLVLTGGGQLGTPRQITSDGRSLIVGDHNARVPGAADRGGFVWRTFPTRDDQPFDLYLPSDPWPRGTFAPDGRLWLFGDRGLLRSWSAVPASADAAPDLALSRAPCASSGDYENVLVVDGRLVVACGNQNVIVVYDSIPTDATQRPAFAIGAPDLDTNTLLDRYVIQNGVPVSSGGALFVGSDFDATLFVWRSLPDRSGAYPDAVYTLPFPINGAAAWGDTLAVAGRQTVAAWKRPPVTGEQPDVVFRQAIGDVRFGDLRGVALDDKYFYLADGAAGAVYVWEGLPTAEARPVHTLKVTSPGRIHADGRYLVVTATSEQAVQVFEVASLSSTARPTIIGGVGRLNLPGDALIAGDHLFVADTANHRVLAWRSVARALAGQWPPDVVLGKPDLYPNGAIGRDLLFRPAALSFDGAYLWVGEFKFSNRLLRFSVLPDQ